MHNLLSHACYLSRPLQWSVGSSGRSDPSSLTWYGSEGHYKDSTVAPGWVPDEQSCTEEERNNIYKQKACFSCGAYATGGLNNYIGCIKNDPLSVISADQSFYVMFGNTTQENGMEVVQCPT